MICEFAALRPPESEAEIEAFDWKAFPPAVANRKNNFFLIVDGSTGLSGKVVTWTTFIHGQVEGVLFAEHVTVEETGIVKGRVFCRTMTVMGKVEADVTCDTLHVRGQGVLSGAVEIVVLVPAEDVLLTEARVPARNRAQLLQALPFAVEDQLLAPVESLHFAAATGEGDAVGVAVVAKATLRSWLDRLSEAGIRADAILPDSLALPFAPDHVTLLAAAYRLSGDARFADHAAAHLKSWWRRNPPLRGIHWLSGIELGMRLIAFVWTRRLLGDWPGVAALFERNADFLLQLHHHERWLATLHSRGSSANNHLIAEAAGLFVAATAFSGTPQQERWAALAAGILEQEALTQTFADGLNRELAFGYHGYVLGLLLLATIEGEADGRPLSDDCGHALTRMADALAANLGTDPAGALQAPRQGDGDDAVALLVDAPETGPWSPLLALASAVSPPPSAASAGS